jgi:hypothetical protein
MNAREALLEAVASVADPEEFEAFTSLLDDYEQLVGQQEYESTPLMAYRFFLAGRLLQEAMDAQDSMLTLHLTKGQASNLIAGLIGDQA